VPRGDPNALAAALTKTPNQITHSDPSHSFGDWLACVKARNHARLEAEYSTKSPMNTTSGTQGGYTVPIEFIPIILNAVIEQSIVRPRAQIVPMHTRTAELPYLDLTKVPATADSSYLGGLVARWTDEASTPNETEPNFRQLQLVAHKLSGYSLFYLIGDRRQLDMTYSPHAKFTNNQAAWKFVSRVDGQPWLSQTVTLQNGQTASNVVYLN
jgi:HK97 family phage major capsid protein